MRRFINFSFIGLQRFGASLNQRLGLAEATGAAEDPPHRQGNPERKSGVDGSIFGVWQSRQNPSEAPLQRIEFSLDGFTSWNIKSGD